MVEHGDGSARDESADESLMARAVLCAAGLGASIKEITAYLSGAEPGLEPDEVEWLIARSVRRGWLRRVSATGNESTYAPTAEGRRAMVRFVADQLAADRSDPGRSRLEMERRQLERLRTDFLATISHELRTPLTLIRTSIGLLLDSDPDEAMRRRLLRNIKQSADRMHALVTDLLDLARLRSERLELQVRRVDVGDLVAGAVSLMRPLLEAKGQRVKVAVPSPAPSVPGDYRRLERVLLNLVGNATKFAPTGTEIDVRVTRARDAVTIAVRDEGPGIPPEGQPHLFEQFYTGRTSSSRHNIGSGLGLPIAKGIVEAHGGRIWVESAVGIGTQVFFSLPKAWSWEKLDEAARGR